MDKETGYRLSIQDNALRIETSSFKISKGSVLHSEVFNRELSSVFFAGGLSMAYLTVMALLHWAGYVHYGISAIVFVLSYPLFRTYIFKEPVLETVIDKKEQLITIIWTKVFGKKVLKLRLNDLRDIVLAYVVTPPHNPDGVAFVQKITSQHGTAIPGLGQTEHYYAVELTFDTERLVIFSSTDKEDSEGLLLKMERFLE
ncbi:MAG: hypothetical protein HQL06_10945 [Nitrospirae bacterium]|nr:hypothetical protein [Nitrospirota bacterium]